VPSAPGGSFVHSVLRSIKYEGDLHLQQARQWKQFSFPMADKSWLSSLTFSLEVLKSESDLGRPAFVSLRSTRSLSVDRLAVVAGTLLDIFEVC